VVYEDMLPILDKIENSLGNTAASSVVIYILLLFQVLHADTVHISLVSNGCKYMSYGRYRLSS